MAGRPGWRWRSWQLGQQLQRVDVAAVVVIDQIVSAGTKVVGGRVVAWQCQRYVVQAVCVSFETQRKQQVVQRSTFTREECDSEVVAPRLAQPCDRAATRARPQHADSRQPRQLGWAE